MSTSVQSRTNFRVLLITYDPSDYNARAVQQRLIDHYQTLVKGKVPSVEETEGAWFRQHKARADLSDLTVSKD